MSLSLSNQFTSDTSERLSKITCMAMSLFTMWRTSHSLSGRIALPFPIHSDMCIRAPSQNFPCRLMYAWSANTFRPNSARGAPGDEYGVVIRWMRSSLGLSLIGFKGVAEQVPSCL